MIDTIISNHGLAKSSYEVQINIKKYSMIPPETSLFI